MGCQQAVFITTDYHRSEQIPKKSQISGKLLLLLLAQLGYYILRDFIPEIVQEVTCLAHQTTLFPDQQRGQPAPLCVQLKQGIRALIRQPKPILAYIDYGPSN